MKNDVVKWLFGFVLCVIIFISCTSSPINENKTKQVHYQVGMEMSFPFNQSRLYHGFPVIYHHSNNGTIMSLIYSIRQTNPNWIDKYEMNQENTIKVDSFRIPEEVFMNYKNAVQEFLVIGLDSFLIQPSYDINKGEHYFFEFSRQHFQTYLMPNEYKGQKFVMLTTNYNPVSYSNKQMIGRVYYLNGISENYSTLDTMCKYNALVKMDLRDSSVTFFDTYNDIFCDNKIDYEIVHYKMRVIKGDSIISLSPFEASFSIFTDQGKVIKPFEFEEFDEHFYEIEDPREELLKNNFFLSFNYNPFNKQFYLLMSEAVDYIKPDEFIQNPKQPKKFTVLVFDEKLNLQGKIHLSDEHSNMYDGILLRSPNGFFLREVVDDVYRIQEFIIE